MNINDFQGGGAERIPPSPKIRPPHFSSGPVPSGKAGESENVKLTEHKRDPEVLQLVQRLSQSPEIRQDRIEEIRQQLASGEFLSRQSAEATAEAFLR